MANNSGEPLAPPLVGAEKSLLEFTVKGVVLGAILSMILAAANAYIGLLVGLTVSASIPAAAVSMGVLRFFKKSNILENNMVQTAASAGESLVAGTIFTIPALVMMKAWGTYEYWPMVSISIVGGVLGVAFTIPLRRALIVDARLKFPEGVATSEVLKTGGIETERGKGVAATAESRSGFRMLMQAAGIGGLFKLLESGLGVFAGSVATTRAMFSGSYLFTGNITISPALVGVGYIVGLNIATLVFLGGVLGTIIGVPLNWVMNKESIMTATGISANVGLMDLTMDQWGALASESWQNCRRIGVGAMIVGGVWSLISLYKPLSAGIRASIAAYKASETGSGVALPRTEMDMPINRVAQLVLLSSIPLFFIFYNVLGAYPDKLIIALVMTILMLFFGFVFSSVAGYMAGLVGSSNNPISGVTIATVIVSALILLQLMGNTGIAATLGPIAVIYLAGLICSAAAIAGDNMQDLKCGHIVGSTPWRQQVYQVVGVVAAAFSIPFVLNILDAGEGIGRPIVEGGSFLAAPQAGLMRDLSTGIFGAGIAWNYIFVGFALAIILIILDKYQEKRGSSFRFPILAVAVGVYLPFGLSITMFFGGLLAHFVNKKSAVDSAEVRQKRGNTGLLLASGLITGEALMGVAVAAAAVIFRDSMPGEMAGAAWLGFAALILVIVYLYRRTMAPAKD